MKAPAASILRFFRHRGAPVLSALLAAFLTPACSVAVAHSYKKVPAFTAATTREEVHRALGRPVRTVAISPPRPLRSAAPGPGGEWPSDKDMRDWHRNGNQYEASAVTAGMTQYQLGLHRAATRDDFRLTGWYAREAEKYGAATSLMSFGILEPLSMQEELEEKSRQEKGVHDISVWYSPEGRYLYEHWKSTVPPEKWRLESERAAPAN